ncbi:MAG: DNA translocase FtsK, partial [Firmicutes bacterium]|nr:DNA translocase FtsK [Bacillota bacterium]
KPQQSQMESLPEKQKIHKRNKYNRPPIDLIRSESTNLLTAQQEALSKQHLLDNKFKEFGVSAKVTNFTVAPSVTRFEVQLDTGTRVSDVTRLETDIAYTLGSPYVRIESTIEGKNAIGIEVPNKSVGMVSIKDLVQSREFQNHKSALAVAIGKNVNDELVIADIATMPHLLIAGSTGSGKSVMLNTILTSLLFRAHPDDVKLILVDMKRVELNMYNEAPHMLVPKAIKEVAQTINALKWMQIEMTRRYDVLEGQGVNNIALYQSLPAYQSGQLERMPYIVMVIDEAADLLARGKKEVEDAIKSLSALARACGIHIILATQRPSVDVITAVIKTNFPVRIAFKVGSRGDSQTIINDSGAEKLVGRGDMLFVKEGYSQRVQGAFIELEETRRVMNFIRENNLSDFDIDLEDLILNGPPVDNNAAFGDNDLQRGKAQDPYFVPILKWIVREDNLQKTVSISNMQRQFSLGFSRAGKIMDQLTGMGYVSLGNGSKARDVIITREEVERLYGE